MFAQQQLNTHTWNALVNKGYQYDNITKEIEKATEKESETLLNKPTEESN